MKLPDSPHSILVIDDSKEVHDLIGLVLRNEFRLAFARNGAEGLEVFAENRPDLILLDIDMPGMDGFEVCRRLKEQAAGSHLPILFLTSKSDPASKKRGLDSGAEDFLTKPFDTEELIARVRAALRTKKLYDELKAAYTVIDRERDLIANIQRSLLGRPPPELRGIRFFSDYHPSSKAGGDYFDFHKIDDAHLGVIISDVSGHGTPAAVIMAMLRTLLRSSFSNSVSPAETLENMNRFLCENLESGYFVTAFYGIIHLKSLNMRYASAGHIPPILMDSRRGTLDRLVTSKGFPLAISPANRIEEREVRLSKGSKLVLYTDGLTEARSPEGDIFGNERLESLLIKEGMKLDPESLGNRIKQAVEHFTRGPDLLDDSTLVILGIDG